jgi:hypothetical protein
MMTAMGMEGFAERARRELLATGEAVSKRTVESLTGLTAQEAQIAKLARDGRTNQEIAAQLSTPPAPGHRARRHSRSSRQPQAIGTRRHRSQLGSDSRQNCASPRGEGSTNTTLAAPVQPARSAGRDKAGRSPR